MYEGDEIKTNYGITQGKNSSCNFFSFNISNMPQCFNNLVTTDAIYSINLLKLADDTVIIADSIDSLHRKFECIENTLK